MLGNYLKIALRNLRRSFGYTLINVFGLAVGLACCVLIYLFIQLEVSYDTLHEKSDHIYRVVTDITQSGQSRELAWSSPPLAENLVNSFPEVEQAVRIHRSAGTMRLEEKTEVVDVSFVDSTFFNVFDFELNRGDANSALSRPGSVVLSKAQAENYFKDENPLGQRLTFADTLELNVTGIFTDIPPNSHFQPEFVANIRTLPEMRFQNWQSINLWTYLVLNDQTSGKELENKLPEFINNRLGEEWAQIMTLYLQPLTSIYFDSDRLPEIGPTGDRSYVYIFLAIGIFTMLIGCINFMNLSTAQSFNRGREVGIRKTLGVHKAQLIRQFLGESVLLVLISLVFGLVIALLAMPVFEQLSGYELSAMMLLDIRIVTGFIIIAVVIGIITGFYPAFVLSLFKPSAVLNGNVSVGESNMKIKSSNSLLRQGLIVVQFIISIVLIISMGVISSQLNYIQNQNLGFDKEQVLVMRLSDRLRNGYNPLKQILMQHSNIMNVGASSSVPGVAMGPRGYAPEGMSDGELLTNTLWIDENYLATMDMDLVVGRAFSADRPSELQNGFLINEAAIGHFGWVDAEQAMHSSLRALGQNSNVEGKIIGVIKDFNYESLHNSIKPLVVRYREFQHFLSIRISGDQMGETMQTIEDEWRAVAPGESLVTWFLDDQLQNLYQSEMRISKLFKYFAGLAVFIACLGLFGLASYSIQKRTKEIGIRKVLGATVSRIIIMLSKEYFLLVLVATIIAWPIGYTIMNRWLEDFAYKTEMPLWVFSAALGVVLILTLIVVGFHSLKAAAMNPVKSLRSE